MKTKKREWHGAHHSWGYDPRAFRWLGEMIGGINLLPIATDMRAWMQQRGHLSLMPAQEAPERSGFTNPYTKMELLCHLLWGGLLTIFIIMRTELLSLVMMK
nr:hypothetical protein KXZ65_09105 [Pectobacterium sp. PL152]